MRFTIAIAPNIVSKLRERNFKRKGNVFLRIMGDGVLQCVFASREPFPTSTMYDSLSISVRSIYEPEVFGDVGIYRGALTYPYSLTDFNLEKECARSTDDLLVRCCLPMLDDTISQDRFCKLIYSLDMACYNQVRWYMEMLMIPAFMRLGKDKHALDCCNRVLLQNGSLPHVAHMKKLLLQNDPCEIKQFLTQTRMRNMEIYNQLRFRK